MSLNNGSEAELIMRYFDEATAEAIVEAVSPDNFQVQEGLELSVLQEKKEIFIRVRCSKRIGSLISTLDDLLSCIAAAEKALNCLDK